MIYKYNRSNNESIQLRGGMFDSKKDANGVLYFLDYS